ncbi:hypothetical protein AB0368_28125 [Actinoplanes sp. NPDC051475]|uniref:hypothetical protein n=1 Tax=Actinoplanes sp. NPDC051475 TaxID=3157225 RepID=UPI00344EDEB5
MDTYVRAVGAAALQGLLTGVWVAAGELPPAKRRLSRAGAVVALSGMASVRDWAFPDEPSAIPAKTRAVTGETRAVPDEAEMLSDEVPPRPISKARLAATGAAVAVSVATMVGGRRLEKRWLGALERDGHAHPHRALGVRMGLISFAATLSQRLIRVHEAR